MSKCLPGELVEGRTCQGIYDRMLTGQLQF
jgi:hypothetical protein